MINHEELVKWIQEESTDLVPLDEFGEKLKELEKDILIKFLEYIYKQNDRHNKIEASDFVDEYLGPTLKSGETFTGKWEEVKDYTHVEMSMPVTDVFLMLILDTKLEEEAIKLLLDASKGFQTDAI